jgi:hypothetical protein
VGAFLGWLEGKKTSSSRANLTSSKNNPIPDWGKQARFSVEMIHVRDDVFIPDEHRSLVSFI